MKLIITDNHIFLNGFDIAPFVDRKSIKVEDGKISLVLLGKVIDERNKPKKEKVKAVNNDG